MGRVDFVMEDDFCVELTPGAADAAMSILLGVDACDMCGRPVRGDTTCRQCRKTVQKQRRMLQLAKERQRRRAVYGKI